MPLDPHLSTLSPSLLHHTPHTPTSPPIAFLSTLAAHYPLPRLAIHTEANTAGIGTRHVDDHLTALFAQAVKALWTTLGLRSDHRPAHHR